MEHWLEKILFDTEAIDRRLDALAQQINRDYSPRLKPPAPGEALPTDEQTLMLVPLLNGAILFVSDLMRRLDIPLRIKPVRVQSYPGKSTTSQGAYIGTPLDFDLKNQHVLIIDDIYDTGQTLGMMVDKLSSMNPASLGVCVLLRKDVPRKIEVPIDYCGFDIPDEFVVGYGLDFDGQFRQLPYIATLKPEAYT